MVQFYLVYLCNSKASPQQIMALHWFLAVFCTLEVLSTASTADSNISKCMYADVCCIVPNLCRCIFAAFTYGKRFAVGFMSNINPKQEIDFAKAFITTDSDTPVNITITASIEGMTASTEEIVPSAKNDLVKVPFPQELLVTQSDFENRGKGILIEVTSEGTISVLMQNFFAEGSTGEYLAYPCMDPVLDDYTYYAISTDSLEQDARSEVLLVACHNDTNVTITPTQPVVLPLDTQDPNSTNVTVPAGCNYTVILHVQQTLLIAVTDMRHDLTGSKIVSSKPLTVISGHECGDFPQGVDYCEHLTVQIPPTVTWERSFFLPPLALRRSQIYRVTPSHDNTIITYTCDSTTTTATIPTAGLPHSFKTEGDTFCTLESNKPVFVTRWSLGGHTDREGDPTVSPVAAVTQYINSVSFVNLPFYDWLNTYVSVTMLAEFFTETSILIDDEAGLFDCRWHPFRNSTNDIVGYGCNSRAPDGSFTMRHNRTDGLFSVIPYGFEPCNTCSGYAYIAGMKFDSTGMHIK